MDEEAAGTAEPQHLGLHTGGVEGGKVAALLLNPLTQENSNRRPAKGPGEAAVRIPRTAP